jgi:hypothetical protein
MTLDLATEPIKKKWNKILVAIAVVAVAFLIVAAISAYSYFGTAMHATINQEKEPVPTFNQLNISTIDNGVEFTLMLNTTQLMGGHALNITASVRNLLPTITNITADSVWALPSLRYSWTSVGCSWYASYQVFQGYYLETNISSEVPLQIWDPNFNLPCPALWMLLEPQGAFISNNTLYLPLQPYSEKIAFRESVSGYYYKSGQLHVYTPFPEGVYTVAAGNGWGQLVILHFSVL